jgi:hypothetical protein
MPLVARNVAVGVAPWALASSGVETFIHGHAAGASTSALVIPPATRSILEQSDGQFVPAVRLTLDTWEGDWGRLVQHEFVKLGTILSNYEGTDNVSWQYFADRSPILPWLFRFGIVLAIGLVGMLAPGARADRRLLVYFLIAAWLGLMYGVVLGRYRLVSAAVLWIYAGAAVTWIHTTVLERRWKAAGGILLAAVMIGSLSMNSLAEVRRRNRYRASEYFLAAKTYLAAGEKERSFEEMREGLRRAYRGPDQTELPGDFRLLLQPFVLVGHGLGRDVELAADLETLVRAYPSDPDLRRALGVVLLEGLGRREEAAVHFAAERRLRGK